MIDQFRALWNDTRDEAAVSFGERARGKVAIWSLERAVAVLRASARSTVCVKSVGDTQTSHQETALLATVAALKAGDPDRAAMQAIWLVKRDAVPRLLRSLAPLAHMPSPQYAAAA
ncbi:MAG: hypothetical protein WA954_00755 [Parerythrobacter sp.]